ncbi:hypothetical protein M422DRAFT_247097 [Sphaerobolus stellatus SS14]|nr:hypothetical protein M422DRAFT_247097 [Sphaerobolus stellatus SS14]
MHDVAPPPGLPAVSILGCFVVALPSASSETLLAWLFNMPSSSAYKLFNPDGQEHPLLYPPLTLLSLLKGYLTIMESVAELIARVPPLRIAQYSLASVFTLLVYDYAITFGAEVASIWKSRFSFVKLLFLMNRYIGFTVVAIDVISESHHKFIS